VAYPFETVNESRFLHRLSQIADGSIPQRPSACRLIGKGRHENERGASAGRQHTTVQFDAAHARHLNICDHAMSAVDHVGGEECLGRGEGKYVVTEQFDETCDRPAEGLVIIDDANVDLIGHAAAMAIGILRYLDLLGHKRNYTGV
jgi:hypothetical protein